MSQKQPAQGEVVVELDWLSKALGVVARKVDDLQKVEEKIRAKLTSALGPQGRRSVYDPQHPGGKGWKGWGMTASETSYKAEFTDRSAAAEWTLKNYEEKAETRTRVRPDVPEHEWINVLRKHASYMLEEVREVPEYVLADLLRKSQAAGEPMGFNGELGENAPPGISVTKPDSVLSVKFYAPADAIVSELEKDDRFSLDTITAALAGDE